MYGLRAVVERDLQDAWLTGLSEDRRFATAYNCVLQLAKMAIACAGYRVTAKRGHHENTFIAVRLAIGPSVANLSSYFDTCRRKRNLVDYNLADVVTETELDELLEKAVDFRDRVEHWIADHHPHLT